MDAKPLTIEDALRQLGEAQATYDAANEAKRAADSNETNARNRLNKAQDAFDQAVAAVRKGAPWNTNWHSASRLKVEVGE